MSASRHRAENVHRLALPGLVLGAALISFSGIFVKLSEVGPTATGFYRMSLSLPFFFVWMMRDPGRKQGSGVLPADRRALGLALLAGLALAADLVAWHWCLHITTVATATLLGNTAPIWVALGGFLFFRERFDALFLGGLALSVIGVWGLVAGGTRPIEFRDGLAIGLGLFTGIAYAGYLRGGTAARRGLSTAQVMFWGSVAATLPLLPIALATEAEIVPHSLHGWAVVVGLSLLSQVLGQSMINWAMGHLPAAFSSLALLLNPLFAALCAWPILGEALTLLQMLSGLGVILGILLARRARAGNGRATLDPAVAGLRLRHPPLSEISVSLDRKELLRRMFAAAIGAVDPLKIVPGRLPAPPKGRTIVVGAGKAAAAMAKAVEDNWQGPLQGLVITRYGHGMPTRSIEVVEAAHPVPDAAGQQAARRILDQVRGLTPDDLVLCLISGGASALMAVPGGTLTLADKQAVNKGLLKSGANIAEMNCVRKHLSGIKGGRLAAAAYPAQVVTLLISDVPGDDPSVIGSGPTVPDPTSAADADAILKKYRMQVPDAVIRHLQSPAAETPSPGDPRLASVRTVMLGTPQAALDAAAKVASDAGFRPVILGDLEGEARDVALVHAGIARQIARHGQPVARPAAIISGGETTVTVRGNGRGGRNAEFLLALAVALDGQAGIHALAGDTDGIDGTEENAGALLAPDSLARGAKLGVDAKARLADNDGYGFFAALDDLVITGPTRTNVNDFRAILID